MAKFNRSEMKKQLAKRTQESNAKTESQAKNNWEYYLDVPKRGDDPFPTYSILKTATEVNKEVQHFFNIIVFKVGDKYPNQDDALEPGEWAYFLDLWVHIKVGHENKRLVCPKRNYGKRCPICEHRDKKLKDATSKEERSEIYKELNPQRRSIYFIRVSEDGESNTEFNKGVQIMDVAYNWMEKELQKQATLPRGGGIVPYADPDDGKEIMVVVKKLGEGYYKVDQHKLLDRDYVIEDEEIGETFPIDNYIKLYSYNQIATIYNGEDEEEEEGTDGQESSMGDDIPDFSNEVSDDDKKEDDKEDGSTVCPVGGVFGENYAIFEECDSCEIDTDCKMKKREGLKKPTLKKGPTRKRPILDDDVPF